MKKTKRNPEYKGSGIYVHQQRFKSLIKGDDGTQWVLNNNNIYNAGASIGINTGTTPAVSAYLDISGEVKDLEL